MGKPYAIRRSVQKFNSNDDMHNRMRMFDSKAARLENNKKKRQKKELDKYYEKTKQQREEKKEDKYLWLPWDRMCLNCKRGPYPYPNQWSVIKISGMMVAVCKNCWRRRRDEIIEFYSANADKDSPETPREIMRR